MENLQEIEDAVADIMRVDGPDRHVDGHEVIAAFIVAIQQGEGYEWIASYREKHKNQLE